MGRANKHLLARNELYFCIILRNQSYRLSASPRSTIKMYDGALRYFKRSNKLDFRFLKYRLYNCILLKNEVNQITIYRISC